MAEFVIDAAIDRVRPATGEGDFITKPRGTAADGTYRGMIYSHGSGGNGAGPFSAVVGQGEAMMTHALCGRMMMISADWGGTAHWGNDVSVAALEAGYDLLIAKGAKVAPMVMVGGSMGNLNVLRYIKKHPDRVAAYVGIIPALNLVSIRANIPSARAPQDVAWGVTYPAALPVFGAGAFAAIESNPYDFADELTCPMIICAASDDAIVYYADAQAFVALARTNPAADVTLINLGAVGHTDLAVKNSIPFIDSWLKARNL